MAIYFLAPGGPGRLPRGRPPRLPWAALGWPLRSSPSLPFWAPGGEEDSRGEDSQCTPAGGAHRPELLCPHEWGHARGTGALQANVVFHTRLRETKTQPVFEAGLRMTWMAHCDQHWSSARPPAQSKAQSISPSRCARPSQFNSHGLQNCIASVYTRIVSLDGHIG